jgi:hypothetical protein
MEVTKKLLMKLRNSETKRAVTIRMDQELLDYISEDSERLNMSKTAYIEALILAKAASDEFNSEAKFSIRWKQIKEYF